MEASLSTMKAYNPCSRTVPLSGESRFRAPYLGWFGPLRAILGPKKRIQSLYLENK